MSSISRSCIVVLFLGLYSLGAPLLSAQSPREIMQQVQDERMDVPRFPA